MIRAADISTEMIPEPLQIQPGDIFACWAPDLLSRFISIETSLFTWPLSPKGLRLGPSHVAIACPRFPPHHSRCWWIESTTMTRHACIESGKPVSGVQVHPVHLRLQDYLETGRVDLYRLTPINALTPDQIRDMRNDLISWFVRKGISYDAAGAVFSGTRLIRSIDKVTGFLQPRFESVFCSQLIAAELMSLCRMNRDNPVRYNPGRLLRTLVHQGTYTRVRSLTAADLDEVKEL